MDVGAPELLLVILVIVLLFGAKKLPELARGSGRALRIFKAETRGLADDDDHADSQQRPVGMNPVAQAAGPDELPTERAPGEVG